VTTLKPQERSVVSMFYVVAAVIIVDQALDWIGVILPLRTELATWRFGSFGLAIGRLGPLALADALLLSAALVLDHRRMLLFLGLLHGLIGLCLALGLGLFTLDGLELRRAVTPERKREVLVAAARTLVTGGVAFLASAIIAVGLLRSQRDTSKRERSRDPYLVAGKAGAKADE